MLKSLCSSKNSRIFPFQDAGLATINSVGQQDEKDSHGSSRPIVLSYLSSIARREQPFFAHLDNADGFEGLYPLLGYDDLACQIGYSASDYARCVDAGVDTTSMLRVNSICSQSSTSFSTLLQDTPELGHVEVPILDAAHNEEAIARPLLQYHIGPGGSAFTPIIVDDADDHPNAKEYGEEHNEEDDDDIEDDEAIGVYLKNGKLGCPQPSCNARRFGRLAELKRHYETFHAVQKPQYWCEFDWCSRGRDGIKPFNRQDKRRDHMRNIHGE